MANWKRNILALFLLGFLAAGCGQGTTIVGNSSEGTPQSKITISKLVEGESTVTVPEEAFGDSQRDVVGATIDVNQNGVRRITAMRAYSFYDASARAVIFTLDGLSVNDVLEFIIHKSNGGETNYRGSVSDQDDSFALNEAADSEFAALTDGEANTIGSDALAARDIATAQAAYCSTFDNGSLDSNIAFGCFLSSLLALPETTDAQALLASMDAEPLDTEEDILEGIFDTFTQDPFTPQGLYGSFVYNNYSQLPWQDIFSDDSLDPTHMLAQMVIRMVGVSTTAQELEDNIISLRDNFVYLESCLNVVLNDNAFAFNIPAELFGTVDPLTVTYNDARLSQASAKSTIVSLNIFDAYDLGVEFENVINDTGTDLDYEVLVADLNGTGEEINGVDVDETAIFTLDEEDLIEESEDRFREFLVLFRDGMQTLANGEQSEFLPISDSEYQDWEDAAQEALTSLNQDRMVDFTLFDPDHDVQINLKNFFQNPPSATDVHSVDPAVLGPSGNDFEFVEAFFHEFFDNIIEW